MAGMVGPSVLMDLNGLSDQELIRAKARLGLQNPYYFETDVLQIGKDDDLPRPEREVRPTLLWFDQARSKDFPKKRRFLIYWSSPRFTAKTFCCAAMMVKRIIVNPNIAIMIICQEKGMAAATVALMKEWLESPEVERLYGRFKTNTNWGTEEFTVAQRTITRRDPTVKAYGLEVPLQSWHPDVIWWDDLIGEANNTLDGYRKAEAKLAASMPVLRQDGMGIYTCTRWGEEDPAGKILKKASKNQQWKSPPGRGFFGAYAVPGDELFYPDAIPGEPLYPTILPEEEIESYRQDWPFDVFSAQILNDPAPMEGRTFDISALQYFNPYPHDDKNRLHDSLLDGLPFMAFDPAGGKEQAQKGDRSALGVGFARWQGKTPQLWMVDVVGGRWSTQKCYDNFFNLVEKWRPVKIFIEKNKGEEWLLDPLRKRAQLLGIHLPIETVHWGKGDAKKDRIRSLVQPMNYHQLFLADHLRNGALVEDFVRYRPGGQSHDDFADMMAILWLKALAKKKAKRIGDSLKVGKAHGSLFRRRGSFGLR